MYDHKEMTAHIRKRIKIAKIKARVSMSVRCGTKFIEISVPAFEARFTADEIETIARICSSNKLTGIMGSEIDPEHERLLVEKIQWSFEFRG